MAKAMTPEDLYLINEALFGDYWETGSSQQEDDYSSICLGDGSRYQQLEMEERIPRGEIEQAESRFRFANMAFRLDSIRVEEGALAVSPRPHFNNWREYLRSMVLSGELSKEEGDI